MIAERLYESGSSAVRLRLYAPERDADAWRCRITIDGGPFAYDRVAFGEDGVQALVLALELARVLLRTAGHDVTLDGQPDLMLPVMSPNSPVR